MSKCELCGSEVRIVGHTTKHYEPEIDIDQADLCCQIYDLIEKGKAGEAVLLLRSYIAKELKESIITIEMTDGNKYVCRATDIKHKLEVE